MEAAIRVLLVAISQVLISRNQHDLAAYVALAETLIKAGSESYDELAELTHEIKSMVAEGREPTAEEFAAVESRRAELSKQIEEAMAALDNPPPT